MYWVPVLCIYSYTVTHFLYLLFNIQDAPVSVPKDIFREGTKNASACIKHTESHDSVTTVVSDVSNVSTPAGAEKFGRQEKSTVKKIKKQYLQAKDENNSYKKQLTFALETTTNQSVTLSNQSVALTTNSATMKDQQGSIRELTGTVDSSKQAISDLVGITRDMVGKKDHAEKELGQEKHNKEMALLQEKHDKEMAILQESFEKKLAKQVAQVTVDQEEEDGRVGFFYQS